MEVMAHLGEELSRVYSVPFGGGSGMLLRRGDAFASCIATGVRNDQRNAAYRNVDLRVAKGLNLGRGVNMQLSAEVFNLLNDDTLFIVSPLSQSDAGGSWD